MPQLLIYIFGLFYQLNIRDGDDFQFLKSENGIPMGLKKPETEIVIPTGFSNIGNRKNRKFKNENSYKCQAGSKINQNFYYFGQRKLYTKEIEKKIKRNKKLEKKEKIFLVFCRLKFK